MSNKRLVVVVGATGSGKTDLSIDLARHFAAPVLSADSRQFYRGMAIGTAQPSPEQLQAAEHHFIASHEVTEELNCGEYETLALTRLAELFRTHDYAIAVGGSGLYIRALCEGLDDLPQADEALRTALMKRFTREGIVAMAEELGALDPAYYEIVDRNNPARVLRALEVCLQTGRPYSEQRTGIRRHRDFQIIKIGIDMNRPQLYERIDRRVELMLESGLESEARVLYPHRNLNALQTVGYKELFDYFEGKCSLEEAATLIKRNSRRYAKRQTTWFRRDSEIRWFGYGETPAIINYIKGLPNPE